MNRRRWWIVGALSLVAVPVIAAALAWYAQSGLARWLAIRQIGDLTNRQATMERLDLDLARGRLEIAGFRLADRVPGPPVTEIDRLAVDFDPLALLRGRIAIREVALGGVRVRVVRSIRGELNIADLLAREPQGGSPDLTLGRLTLEGGAVSLEDHTRTPVPTWRAEDIALELSGLSTRGAETSGAGRFTAVVAGAPMSGEVSDLRATPLHFRGRLVMTDVDATLAGIYLPPAVQAFVEGARLTASVAVEMDARDGLRLDADGRLEGLAIKNRRNGDPLAEVPSLAVSVSGARIDASGRAPRPGRIEVTGAATVFDARGASSGRFEIERLRVQIADVEGSSPSTARVAMTAGLPGGGRLDVQGPLRLAPLGAELRARVVKLDPSVLMSHVDLPVRPSGVVDSDLAVDVGSAGGLTARVRGRTAVSRVTVADGNRPVATADRIEVDGIEADGGNGKPFRIGVARVRVVQPVASLERDRAGRIPLVDRLSPPVPAASKTPAPAAKAPASPTTTPASPTTTPGAAALASSAVSVVIAEVAVEGGTIALDDAAAQPPGRLTVAKLRARARNVEWPARRPVAIEVQAAAPGAGTIEARGTIALDPLRLDLRTRVAGAALAPYQGYIPLPARIEGSVDADVAVTGTLAPTIGVTARGTVSLTDLTASDGGQRAMRVSRVETTGLEYAWPATINVDRLRVGRSRVRIERQADGSIPLRALFTPRPPTGAVGPDGSAPSTPPPFSVTVREALLDEGSARVTDGAVNPAARIDLSGVRLAARNFTWPPRAPMPIELRVGTPGGGTVTARGALDIAARGFDGRVALGGVDLAPVHPYLLLRAQVAGKASGDLAVTARLEPLAIAVRGDAAVADVALAEGNRPLVAVGRVETSGIDYTWPAKVAIDRVRIQKARAAIERQRDGTLPLLALLTPVRAAASVSGPAPAETAPAGTPPAPTGGAGTPPLELTIRETVLDDASVSLNDATVNPPARIELAGLAAGVRDFTWPSRGPTSITARAPMPGGGALSARGQLAAAGKGLDLELALDGVDVAPVRPYVPLRGQVAGKATAKLAVKATLEPLAIAARGTAALADLAVSDAKQRLLTAAHAEVTGLDYAWPATVSVDRLRIQKPWALVDRVSGRLPVLDALALPTTPGDGARRPAAPAPAAAPASLQLSIRRTVIEDGGTTIVDTGVSPPAQLEIGGVRIALRDLAWPARGPAGFTVRASAKDGASIEARGQLRLDPSSIDTTLALANMDLATFQPFVPGEARIAGKASASLHVRGPLVPLALAISGQMSFDWPQLGDGKRLLATARTVDLVGMTAEWPRRRAVIKRVGVREPWALVERDEKGNLPLLALVMVDQPNAAPTTTTLAYGARTAAPRAETPSLEVGALAVEEGFIRFADATTRPRFAGEVSRLMVTAQGLGTAPGTRSELAVTARLTDGAQVQLNGVMGPLGGPLFADVSGKLTGLPLSRVNPYVNGLLGWIARQGSVSGTTRFRIRDDRLQAENEVVIGQPQFVPSRSGDEVRKRVGVPLDLLVSLLENTQREIRLSVPLTGTISSRQFDFGDAVWGAIRKAAINVLALPVSWIGKIFYTADSRIDTIAIWPVSFEPGTTRMRRGIDTHAARLATFMRDTPAMAFTMKPVMTVEDVDALRREAVRQRLAARAGGPGQPDAAALAARLFAERFPGRPVPTELDALVAELARQEPPPDAALRALATQRLDLTRRELVGRGVDAARLHTSEGAVPVESSGAGRVEFEMAPLAGSAS
jgi:hypothetical protein